ncbi:MAG: UDP-2,3-diacylglucosamine diphosphatase [Burkholderiaceae bacterium]
MNLVDPPPALAVTRSIDPLLDPIFISDLHLAPERLATLRRFFRFMASDAPRHRELVILGDLFEFWIGDDASAAAEPVINLLSAASAAGQRVLLMHGNRDPLLGHEFTRAAGATLLADPVIVEVAGTTTLLSHGDAWCTRDVAYQKFRSMVRNAAFQREFLAKPVSERIAIAKSARMQSDTEKATKAMDIMDVTPEAVSAALSEAGVRRIIHGHTHRPAAHVIDLDGAAAERWVLPDWDLDDAEPRGGYLDFVDGQPRLVLFDD